jgi:hypothetical protein
MKVSLDGTKQIVVYAVDKNHPRGKENMLFDRSLSGKYLDLAPFLYERFLQNGIQLITPDIYLAMEHKPKDAIGIVDCSVKSPTHDLIKAGLHMALLIVVETPIYASVLFYNLERETAHFDYAMLPKGAGPRVAKTCKFIPYVPVQMYSGQERITSNFRSKKYMALISANKRVHFLRRWYVHVMNFLKPYPSFVDRELYRERLDAILYFSKDPDFDLYGHGWDQPIRYDNAKYEAAVKRSYRGSVEHKVSTLEKYKFSICFENSIFEGYVTEKIIDPFFAGCIPIYLGAPDVADYIPANCFINFKDFESFEALDAYLKNMSEKTYDEYIANIQAFISSPQYLHYFGKEKFADDLIAICKSYARPRTT